MKFVVLTKSAKYSNYCIAGINLDSNMLVRLVSNNEGAEIKKDDFIFNGKEIEILDLIEIETTPMPLKIQTENHKLIKITNNICKIDLREISCAQVLNNGNLLLQQDYAMLHDEAIKLHNSLMLVDVLDFKTDITKNKTKASFAYNGFEYFNFSVTDIQLFKNKVNFKQCKLILSISEQPFSVDNKHYKFIAQAFNLDGK